MGGPFDQRRPELGPVDRGLLHQVLVLLSTTDPIDLDRGERFASSQRAQLNTVRLSFVPRLTASAPKRSGSSSTRTYVRAGRIGEALERYAGPLMPRSEVPIIAEARQLLDDELRSALLAQRDPALLERWLAHPAGEDDVAVCRELLTLPPEGDGRRPAALSHRRRMTASAGR